VGVRGWVRGLVTRAGEPDVRQAAACTLAVLALVFALASLPQSGGFEMDLRAGDDVGGWDQLTLVGFSINRPFGRFVPDQPGRHDVRIISNRPLPERFDLELTAWTLRPGEPVDLEVRLGDQTRTHRFGADETTSRMSFTNAGRARVIELVLGAQDKLAIQRVAVVESSAGTSHAEATP
jgi:hypothetical protein